MDDLLGGLVLGLIFILVLFNPFTAGTAAYLCKRTGKYLVPAFAGVLVNVVTLTSVVLGIGWLWGEIPSEWFDATGASLAILVMLVSSLVTMLHGLVLVGIVLLVIRERRLGQFMPSKLAMAVFVASPVAGFLFISMLADVLDSEDTDFGDQLSVAYVSVAQDDAVEFKGRTVHLGDDHVFWKWDKSLTVGKLAPGFGQLDEDFSLGYGTDVKLVEQTFNLLCEREGYSCERGERENYLVVSFTRFYSDGDGGYTTTTYYNPECDVYLEHDEKDPEGRYADFVESFFSQGCA